MPSREIFFNVGVIGATAAYGVAIALRADPKALEQACDVLGATRPTAINLKWALDEMRRRLAAVAPSARGDAAMAEAAAICDDEVERCENIGRHGVAVMRELFDPAIELLIRTKSAQLLQCHQEEKRIGGSWVVEQQPHLPRIERSQSTGPFD